MDDQAARCLDKFNRSSTEPFPFQLSEEGLFGNQRAYTSGIPEHFVEANRNSIGGWQLRHGYVSRRCQRRSVYESGETTRFGSLENVGRGTNTGYVRLTSENEKGCSI